MSVLPLRLKEGTASHLVEGWREAVPTHRSIEHSDSILIVLTMR